MDEEIGKVIFKGMGTRLKEKWGIATPEVERIEQTEEQKAYWKQVRTPKERIGEKNVNYENVVTVFKQKMNVVSRKPFVVDSENEDLVKALCLYFSKDDRFLKYKYNHGSVSIINDPDLEKGILIFGNYGFGKSLIMRIFKSMMIPGNKFKYAEANDIVMDYSKLGFEGLENYMNGNCYYDDIGTEDKASHYEKSKEIFKTIIEIRYNKFIRDGTKTHLTSNLDPEEMAERYGHRIESRIYEMFNIIVVNGIDRRKTKRK